MNEKPKEIEERFVVEMVKNHMKMRQRIKQLVVIGTICLTVWTMEAIRSAMHGKWEIASLELVLAIISGINTNMAYRRVI